MRIESVAGENHHICAQTPGGPQHRGKTSGAITTMQPGRIVMIHMQIGTVNDDDVIIAQAIRLPVLRI